jgi:hypothetical protein
VLTVFFFFFFLALSYLNKVGVDVLTVSELKAKNTRYFFHSFQWTTQLLTQILKYVCNLLFNNTLALLIYSLKRNYSANIQRI